MNTINIINVNYKQLEKYFNIYIENNKKLKEIITKNKEQYNFDAIFEKYYKKGANSVETRALLENYNMIFTLNSIIKKNIVGYCYETQKEYICDKITVDKYCPYFFYGIINYHFNTFDNEFVIGLDWEYFSPTYIYYPKKKILYNIDYRYPLYNIENKLRSIYAPNKIILNNKKFKYCIGIIYNFGHYLWNEIFGLMILFENNLLEGLEFIIGSNDFLNIGEILKNKGYNITNITELSELNDPVINCCKIFINEYLIDMLKKFLNIKQKEKKEVINICFDIRTNSRICINEKSMIEYIISKYNDKCVEFYITGWFRKNDNDNDNNIEIQNEIYKDIQTKCNKKIHNLIGKKLDEIISDIENIDIVISNDGSGLSFFSKILTNNINITYTMNSVKNSFIAQEFFFEKFKKNKTYIYLNDITDINSNIFKINNFDEILDIINANII